MLRNLLLILSLTTSGLMAEDEKPASEKKSSEKTPPVNLYNLTPEELEKAPLQDLQKAVKELLERKSSEVSELERLKRFNAAMCARLQQLEEECPAQQYMIPQNGILGLNCKGISGENKKTTKIEVKIENAGGKSFRLVANSLYVSNEFASGVSEITFERIDQKVDKSPRFRELDSLSIVTTSGGSTIENRVITKRVARPKDLKVWISINDHPLVKDFQLALPANADHTSEYRISPQAILQLGRTENCLVTLDQLKALETQAEQGE